MSYQNVLLASCIMCVDCYTFALCHASGQGKDAEVHTTLSILIRV